MYRKGRRDVMQYHMQYACDVHAHDVICCCLCMLMQVQYRTANSTWPRFPVACAVPLLAGTSPSPNPPTFSFPSLPYMTNRGLPVVCQHLMSNPLELFTTCLSAGRQAGMQAIRQADVYLQQVHLQATQYTRRFVNAPNPPNAIEK